MSLARRNPFQWLTFSVFEKCSCNCSCFSLPVFQTPPGWTQTGLTGRGSLGRGGQSTWGDGGLLQQKVYVLGREINILLKEHLTAVKSVGRFRGCFFGKGPVVWTALGGLQGSVGTGKPWDEPKALGAKRLFWESRFPGDGGVGAVGKDISSCYGIPAVGRIRDVSFFVNKRNGFEETRGSVVHYFLLT